MCYGIFVDAFVNTSCFSYNDSAWSLIRIDLAVSASESVENDDGHSKNNFGDPDNISYDFNGAICWVVSWVETPIYRLQRIIWSLMDQKVKKKIKLNLNKGDRLNKEFVFRLDSSLSD